MEESNKTKPFVQEKDILRAKQFLEQNYHKTYLTIFRMAIMTGLRISDVLSLRYDENIKNDEIVIMESKSFKQANAIATNKILADTKLNLEKVLTGAEKFNLLEGDNKGVYDFLTDEQTKNLKGKINKKLVEIAKEKKKTSRHIKMCSLLVNELAKRKKKYTGVDGGYIFAKNTLGRAFSAGHVPICRKSVWKVFREIKKGCGFKYNVACHGLRKTFVVQLYKSSGNDSALVVKTIGWSTDKLVQTYMSINDDKVNEQTHKMSDNLSNSIY